jgi:hypothetical protein
LKAADGAPARAPPRAQPGGAAGQAGALAPLDDFEARFAGAEFHKGLEVAFTSTRAGGLALRIGSKDVRPPARAALGRPGALVGAARAAACGAPHAPSAGCKAVRLTRISRRGARGPVCKA